MRKRFSLELTTLAIFFVSGIAGLIYQSIWSHYLGLLLGHAAYAQTIVLATFMGGMAIGSAIAGRRSSRILGLFRAYAVIEAVIGAVGLFFHTLFVGYSDLSQEFLMPALGAGGVAKAVQWSGAALLIAPQSVLLGMTFPLMSAGLLRASPIDAKRVLGGLYFSNSLGASLGALASTFALMPLVGLPGTLLTAALLNIAVAVLAFKLPATGPAGREREVRVDAVRGTPAGSVGRTLIAAAFITGATSFVYEIGWVRLLNQALGTTLHSFELMLSAFIFGLAMGAWWLKRRSDLIVDPLHAAALAQILMGIAALFSLVAYAASFDAIAWVMRSLSRSDSAYTLFSIGSATIAVLVMVPTAFFAGMTLPLFTAVLLRDGRGERSIGQIYSGNTLGAIVGVVIAVHVLVPTIGVRLAIVAAALLDVALGIYLLQVHSRPIRVRAIALTLGGTAAAVVAALVFGAPPASQVASGVFRMGEARLSAETTVPFLRDGKTSTVAVTEAGGYRAILTNGKPDAALSVRPGAEPSPDEVTMAMAGSLSLFAHPDPRRIAVIGWGSGLTTHTLLGSSVPEVVDTIEIEPAMIEGARLFGARVARAYEDPRSRIHIDDARSFFATETGRYDIVVSEPSNPWVSGVATLFTEEFYRIVAAHLDEDGLMVQWVHTYEISDELVFTMLSALRAVFPQVEMYVTSYSDVLFVAGPVRESRFYSRNIADPALQSELERVGLRSLDDYRVRRVGGSRVLETLLNRFLSMPHSDYFPVVSLGAPKDRFTKRSSQAMQDLVEADLPVLELLDSRPVFAAAQVMDHKDATFAGHIHTAEAIRGSMVESSGIAALFRRDEMAAAGVGMALGYGRHTLADEDVPAWSSVTAMLARKTLPHLAPERHVGLWTDPAWVHDLASQPSAVRRALRAYDAIARRDLRAMHDECNAALASDAPYDPSMRRQFASCVVLSLAASGQFPKALEADAAFEKLFEPDTPETNVRLFLKSWSARHAAALNRSPAS